MTEQIDFKVLVDRLIRDSARATAARQYSANPGIRKWLANELEAAPGEVSSFLADPLFEATFGWEPSGKTWGDLEGNMLSKATVAALDYKNSTHPISRDWDVYSHQLTAIEKLLQKEPVSTVVSSGTGSGKTECFLVPILESLVRQADQQRGALEGVQALFLYPLNALINSQKERLSAWMSPFGGKIRYCLYNGETSNIGKELIPEQVQTRKVLRESPPPLLLTNSTMLEYMLVRSEDVPILEKSQGKLQWIVLDEAHTYIGSQAAEVALLLRRVMIAFGVEPQNVRFVATSATIGDGGAESEAKLREFLADLAGVSAEQVFVATGKRRIPSIEYDTAKPVDLSSNLSKFKEKSKAELFDLFSRSPLARKIRTLISTQPKTIGQLEVATVEEFGKRTNDQWLSLMSLLTTAIAENGEAFLPLRIHLYHRTMAGIWACINRGCSGKPAELGSEDMWKWGSIYLNKTETCPHCQSLVLELVSCSECGTEHLVCDEQYDEDSGESSLVPRLPAEPIDEFSLQIEVDHWDGSGSVDSDSAGEEEISEQDNGANLYGRMPRYIASRSVKRDSPNAEIQGTILDNQGRVGLGTEESSLLFPNSSNLFACAVCNASQTPKRLEQFLFRSARAGMPFYSLVASRNLLRSSPRLDAGTSKAKLPLDGKRIITFSDSRQGTARLSMSQYQDSERNFVRSQIYHRLVGVGLSNDSTDSILKLETEVKALEATGSSDSGIIQILEDKKGELQALKQAAGASVLTWSDVKDKLARVDALVSWSRDAWYDVAFESSIEEREYAEFCLYREFIRRPKRGNTLETLGLVAIRYPVIESISSVPQDVESRAITLDEWKALLTLSVTYIFRARFAVDIPREWTRWLGDKIFPNIVRSPFTDPVAGKINWPTPKNPQSTMVKVLQKALQLDLKNEIDKQWLDSLLKTIWKTLNDLPNSFISNTGEGFELNLKNHAELYIPARVWQCPYTGKAFDKLLRGVSPYTPYDIDRALKLCTEIDMPSVPLAFWTPDSEDAKLDADEWLESDSKVQAVRSALLWENHSDLIARNSDWYASGEHSAQQNSKKLKSLEASFKSGRTNILNCSTTMEMGVDIGGISAVLMNNAPPGPANYLQRAGRAGRRGETASAALTLCSTSAHGAMLFHNPGWPFSAPIAVPRVSLNSADIVQRHVNALLLSFYLKPLDSQLNSNCEWFFDRFNDESSVCENFQAHLQNLIADAGDYRNPIDQLTRRTVLASKSVESVIATALEKIRQVSERWFVLVDSLRLDRKLLESTARNAEKLPSYKAIDFRLRRILQEYLLGELANGGFLPGYGFPTDVVSFVTETIEELKKAKLVKSREDNRNRSRGYPSRDLSIALREYAPGSEIALNGRVYQSGGVSLNWHLPPGVGSSSEVQALKHYWHCSNCGAGDTTVRFPPEQCMYCGSEKLETRKFLEPGGFTVDLMYEPHNDASQIRYMPVVPPRLNINSGQWVQMANRKAGRLRYSPTGAILNRNPGREKHGFSICLRCGRAEEQSSKGIIANKFTKPHYRLRGGKDLDGKSICEASSEDHSIVIDHELAHQSHTSITEVQFNDPDSGAPLADETVAWSLAVALRHGLVQTLGLEEKEVGIAVQETRAEGGGIIQSIFFYDQTSGGAGYSEALVFDLPDILEKASKVLDCNSQCERACHSCLMSYDTQHKVEVLDRFAAKDFIAKGLPDLLRLQPDDCFFGDESRNEPLPLEQALAVAMGRPETESLDILLSGNAEDWELQEWNFLQLLVRYGTSGLRTRIAIQQSVLEQLPDHQIRYLAALSQMTGISLHVFKKKQPLKKNGGLLAVLTANNKHSAWASHSESELTPGEDWCASLGTLVRANVVDNPFESIIEPMAEDALEKSTVVSAGTSRLTIFDELNVPVGKFADKLWAEIYKFAPDLESLFKEAGPASKIVYTDKFIKTPLGCRLLSELVLGLPSEVLGENTSFNVNTVQIPQDNRDRTPRLADHDWNVDNHRRGAMAAMLREMGWKFGDTDVKELSRVPHYRELQITWPNNKRWTAQFDQGFGCWRPAINEPFPFQQSVVNQGSSASRMNLKLTTRNENFKNYIFVDNSLTDVPNG